MDRLDGVVLVGTLVLVGSVARLDGLLVATLFAGFLVSVAVWRVYGGRPWEALGWMALAAGAITVVFDVAGPVLWVALGGFLVLGVALIVGERAGALPPIWSDEHGRPND